jgi:beta-glucanase (GH16 family)
MNLARRALFAAAAATALLGITVPAHAQSWNLVWSEEFNGPSGSFPDSSRWGYDVGNNGGWGNGEWEHYCAAGSNTAPCSSANPNVFMNGSGSLVIRARRDAAGTWTSTRMLTRGKFSVQYGRIEARMRLVPARGLWPAFWMLGTDIGTVGWPSCGEIDIMEWVINYGANVTSSALHGPGYSGGGNIGVSAGFPNGTRVDDPNFHIYGVIWSPNQIQFYRDSTSNIIRTITPANIPPGTTWAYNHPFFIILNQAVGGNWFPGPDASTPTVNDILIDYVRVYQSGSQPPPPPPPPPTGGMVSIRASANNSFVAAENGGAAPLVANRGSVSTWEQFRVVENSDGTVSLQAVVNGLYVGVDVGNGGRLIANRTAIGTQEKFRRSTQPNGTVALQSVANNQYVAADLNVGNVLIANRGSPSTWERFTLSPL